MATGGSINTDILSDETFDLLCVVCKRKGKNTEAEKYCVECQDYYCLTCVKVHEDIPSLTGHKILNKGQFPSGSVKMLRSGKTSAQALIEKCDRHTHNYIDMYCQNHDVVGCGTCMAVDHRLCKDLFYIPDFLQTNTSTTTTQEIQQKLESVSNILTEYHENFKREKRKLLNRKTTILEKVKQFRKEINERLDELEKNTITDMEEKYKAIIEEIEKAMKVLQTNKANVTGAKDKVASTGNNPSHIFVNVKKGQQIADTAAINAKENKPQLLDIEFQADQRISTLLTEINGLGQITQKKTRDADYMGSDEVQKKEVLLQVNNSKKYSVRVKSDKEVCHIVSACTLEDGTIILSDCSNKKLKRLDSSTYTVTDYCDLPGYPCQVCSINKQQAAVCLTSKEEVHFISLSNRNFISLSNRMKLTNKIKTDFYCCGLAYANGNLYISDRDTSVYIYSVSGRKLKQFSKDQSGEELFSNIRSLAVSEDGSRIYVADFYNGLIILDNNGKVVGRLKGPRLRNAYGSYLTGRGSLLVCGDDSNNVLQFGLDGELIGEVVKRDDENAYYQAICCNQRMTKMIIGRWRDKIEVYDLK